MSNTDKKNMASPASTPATTTPATTTLPTSGQAKPPTNGTAVFPGNGTVAAAAASSGAPPPAGAIPATTDSAPGTGTPLAEDESDPLLYFIVVGPVESFKTVAKAEAYLNAPGAPTDYTVIRGRAAPAKKRVSLRG